jgi:hypothetical protein
LQSSLDGTVGQDALVSKEPPMIIDGLHVPPFNTTLLGVARAVATYYGLPVSDPMLFGGTGHAFLTNIHETLCPSGPYCWNRKPFFALLANIGAEMTDQGFFSKNNTLEERAGIETLLKDHLDQGGPCALVNMEYQLISGYDASGFITSQPWAPHSNFPPGHLTFGSWAEFGSEIHVNFFTFNKVDAKSERDIILGGLKYAIDLYENPSAHTAPPYSTGAEAYETWVTAVENGHGADHGNWWNATVWGESRRMAARFFAEIQSKYPRLSERSAWLAEQYGLIADRLSRVSDKAGGNEEKIRALREAASMEKQCIARIREVVELMAESG